MSCRAGNYGRNYRAGAGDGKARRRPGHGSSAADEREVCADGTVRLPVSPLRQVRDFTSRPRRRPAARLAPGTPQCAAGLAGRPAAEEAAREAARTAPPRENGGNQDIKNLTRGARIFLPVFVDGGKLSAGDLHFSQGDGEITFCGAIEMGGYLDLRIDLIKDGMQTCGVTSNPVFMPGNVEPRYSEFLTFVGRARSPRSRTRRPETGS